MKKDLVATISSSMKFYTEEVKRLNIFKWGVFLKIYKPQHDLIHCESMTPEEKKEDYNRLLEEHKAKMRKSDYLIVINKDGYIGNGVKEEIAYADEIGLGILYTEYIPEYTYIGTICHDGHTYYLRAPKLGYMEDSITECNDFILSEEIKKIRLASIADKPNVNNVQYGTDDIIKSLKNERIQTLLSTNQMSVEWGSSAEKYNLGGALRLNTIDPKMVVGKVNVLGKKYLFITPNNTFTTIFNNSDESDLLAYMRYIGKVDKREDGSNISDVSSIIITTWDIWYNKLSEEYLKTIS